MKKWILGAVAFAALFWTAHIFDHRHAAPANMPVIQVSDPAEPEPAVEPVPPPVSAPAPAKRPPAKHKGNPIPKPPQHAAGPDTVYVSAPKGMHPTPCYWVLLCM